MMRALLPTLVLAATLTAAGCGEPEPAAPVDRSVTNEDLGLRLVSMPTEFVVAVNQGKDLELEPIEESRGELS